MPQTKQNMTFLTGANAEYISHLYGEFLSNPAKVDVSWKGFFEALNDNEVALLQELNGASWTPKENRKSTYRFAEADVAVPATKTTQSGKGASQQDLQQAAKDSIQALKLIRSYRSRGHLMCDLDPLGLREKPHHPELEPAYFGFMPDDYNRPIFIGGELGMETATVGEMLTALKQTYCGTIGVEFLHLTNPEERDWVRDRIEEPRNKTEFSPEGKRAILQRMAAAEMFEQFLHKKYPGTKRFGVDGGEA